MMAVPAATPETMPAPVTVAFVLPLLQVPPAVDALNVVVDPEHKLSTPDTEEVYNAGETMYTLGKPRFTVLANKLTALGTYPHAAPARLGADRQCR